MVKQICYCAGKFIALKPKEGLVISAVIAVITAAYALLIYDFIPDYRPVIGLLDDVILLPAMITFVILIARLKKSINNKYVIAIEGIDGSGKTTQCIRLLEYLRARDIKARLVGRRFIVSSILSFVSRSDVIIADRYVHTLNIYLRQTEHQSGKLLSRLINKLPEPQILLFLEIDVNTALERIMLRGKKLGKYETREGLKIFTKGFDSEFVKTKSEVYRINARDTSGQIHEQITKIVTNALMKQAQEKSEKGTI